MSNGPATMSPLWADGRQSRNFMNINYCPDLCLGPAYFHRCLYCVFFPRHYWCRIDRWHGVFVTDFGIVSLDRLPFYRNNVTRSARAHDYAKSRTNRRQSRPNRQHCRRFGRHCRRFVPTWQKYWFSSKVASAFDFVASVYRALAVSNSRASCCLLQWAKTSNY